MRKAKHVERHRIFHLLNNRKNMLLLNQKHDHYSGYAFIKCNSINIPQEVKISGNRK